VIDIEDNKGEEHRHLVKDVHVPLVVVERGMDGRVRARREFNDAEDDTELRREQVSYDIDMLICIYSKLE
jgi:hypothetical protein